MTSVRGSLGPTLVGSSSDEEDTSCSFLHIQPSPCSVAELPSIPTPSEPESSLCNASGVHPTAAASWHQMCILPVLYLSYLGAQAYIYAKMFPIVAVLLLCGLSVEYFWMSSDILLQDTGIVVPSQSQPLCIRLTAPPSPCSSWRRIVRPVGLATAVSVLMGAVLIGAASTGLAVLVGRVEDYTHELIVLGGVTGAACGCAAMLCPTWRAAASLAVYALAFLVQSVNWVAFDLEAEHHMYILDNGELLAQAGVVVIVAVLFQNSTNHQRILLHIAQHVGGLLHVYGPCAVLGGYIACSKRKQAIAVFDAVVLASWGVSLGAFLAHRWPYVQRMPGLGKLHRILLIPSMGTLASPTLLGVLCGSLTGVASTLVATVWLSNLPFRSLWLLSGYTFLATFVAQTVSGWWALLLHRANQTDPDGRYHLTRALVVVMPLVVCFYPYYSLHNLNEFVIT